MINAAAMLICLWILWIALGPHPISVETMATGAGAALGCVLISARLRALDKPGVFFAAPRLLTLAAAQAPRVLRGALATSAAALRPQLRPALVRIRTRPGSGEAQAAFADFITAAPGSVVVETDAEGLLAHVLDEDAVDGAAWTRLETQVIAAVDGGRP